MNEMISPNEGPFRSYDEALEWITHLYPVGEKPGLERMHALMERLGHPERRLKFIHVAGTNGKGSTCAFLTRALIRGGYDVGTFTSPYIEKFTDRIRYNGMNISDDELLRLANLMKPIVDEIAATPLKAPTMFDVTTAIAIQYYATNVYPDFVVWETGIGGRLDPTNIVTPILSIITNVGHDHMEMLGDTLAKVAFEKAGIIKSGVPVVSAVEQQEALEVIERIAMERQSTLYLLDRQFAYESLRCEQDSQAFHFRGPFRRIPDISISLNGKHQVKNASLSLMALEVLRQYYAVLVDDEPLLEAMKETAWPGRLEMICEHPRILIDGAHNPEGAQTLAAALKDVYSYEKLHLMMGMLTAKNHSGYFGHILPLVDTLVVTEPDWHKKTDAAELAGLARQMLNSIGRSAEVIVEPNWRKALDLLRERTKKDDLAVVSGTLYLVSDVRSHMTSNSILPKSVKLEL